MFSHVILYWRVTMNVEVVLVLVGVVNIYGRRKVGAFFYLFADKQKRHIIKKWQIMVHEWCAKPHTNQRNPSQSHPLYSTMVVRPSFLTSSHITTVTHRALQKYNKLIPGDRESYLLPKVTDFFCCDDARSPLSSFCLFWDVVCPPLTLSTQLITQLNCIWIFIWLVESTYKEKRICYFPLCHIAFRFGFVFLCHVIIGWIFGESPESTLEHSSYKSITAAVFFGLL